MTQGDSPRKPLEKRLLDSSRVRRIGEGFSWIDRRFVREFVADLTRDEILLYFFLAAVSDCRGLSFYGDGTAAALLKISIGDLEAARSGLVAADLLAYRRPLYQVLEMPERRRTDGPASIAEILRDLARKEKA